MLTMEDIYNIDNFLNNYLINTNNVYNLNIKKEIFYIVNNLNNIVDNENILSLSTLELELLDIITNKDEENDVKKDLIDLNIKNTLIEYFKNYNITLNNDITLHEIKELLKAWYALNIIEDDTINFIEHLTTSGNDVIENFSTILSYYSNLNYHEVYLIIEDVDEDIVDNLLERLKNIKLLNNELTLNKDDIDKIFKLNIVDDNFKDSYIVNYFMQRGNVISLDKDFLYNSINIRNIDVVNIPYEIVAFYYLYVDGDILFNIDKDQIIDTIVEYLFLNNKIKDEIQVNINMKKITNSLISKLLE
jgi:hypothetical protein